MPILIARDFNEFTCSQLHINDTVEYIVFQQHLELKLKDARVLYRYVLIRVLQTNSMIHDVLNDSHNQVYYQILTLYAPIIRALETPKHCSCLLCFNL